MAHQCFFCEKKTAFGRQSTRSGLAKKKGGNGQNVTGKTRRTFKPNMQKVRHLDNGTPVRVLVCTSCIRDGKVVKPPKQKLVIEGLVAAGKLQLKEPANA